MKTMAVMGNRRNSQTDRLLYKIYNIHTFRTITLFAPIYTVSQKKQDAKLLPVMGNGLGLVSIDTRPKPFPITGKSRL